MCHICVKSEIVYQVMRMLQHLDVKWTKNHNASSYTRRVLKYE